MKKITYSSLVFLLILSIACEQVPIELVAPDVVVPPPACPAGASAGTASFTKFVAIGNSFVAGVQGGALFTDGQNNSLAAILNKQFVCVGAPSDFKQPNIGATLGWNLFVTQPILGPPFNPTKAILGRMLLQGASPRPTPQPYAVGNLEALPNPAANPGFIYTGGKAALNNFAVPAIFLGQALIPQTGAWAGAATDPRFSPFYGRLAFPGTGASTILGDAAAAGGSFFLFWLGMDDFFLHAAFGADAARAPLTVANGGTAVNFDAQYTVAITSLLGSNPNLKGVVANFPDIFKMPHFTSVSYNPIPLDAATSGALNAGFAGYNAAIDGLKNPAFGGAFGNAATLDARKVSYITGSNKVLLKDDDIQDLGPGFDALLGVNAITAVQRAQLAPYQKVRQSATTDVLPLGAGTVLGTPGTFGILGLSEPLPDRFVITSTEKAQIVSARTAYNAIISAIATANSSRVALADVSAAMDAFTTAGAYFGPTWNGVTITPNINPPTGVYSEDGAHFNTRGYAFISRTFISAINSKFGATIPLTNIGDYKATGLPIP